MLSPSASPISSDPVAMLAIVALGGLLLHATVRDLATRRIPNATVVAGLAIAGACHAIALAAGQRPLAGGTWLAPVAGLLAGFVALLPLYLLRACAAGDVKLLAMVGAFTGPLVAAEAALATLVAGGLLSLAVLARPGVAGAAWRRLRAGRAGAAGTAHGTPLERTAYRLPYAAAIAAGTAAALGRHLAMA